MNRRTIGCVVILMLVAATTKPATTQKSGGAGVAAGGGRVWHLNQYLDGTTAQVSTTLNREVNRLTAKRREQAIAVEQQQRALADAPKSDPAAVAAARKELASRHAEFTRIEKALANAVDRRSELLAAMRFTFQLHAPLRPGDRGILGEITPQRFVDDHTCVVLFNATHVIDDAAADSTATAGALSPQPDGLRTLKVESQIYELLLTGIDRSPLRLGEPTTLDRVFTVDGNREIQGIGEILVLNRTADAEIDGLFQACEGAKATRTTTAASE